MCKKLKQKVLTRVDRAAQDSVSAYLDFSYLELVDIAKNIMMPGFDGLDSATRLLRTANSLKKLSEGADYLFAEGVL